MKHHFWNLLHILLIAFGNQVMRLSYCSVKNIECYPSLCDTESLQRCSCHKYCNLYNECCSDVINETISDHGTPSVDYSCRKISDNKLESYFLFDRCPSNHSVTEHLTYCETPNENDQLYTIPALGKRTKRLYRNLFCALCNGEEYILWTVHYKCNHQIDMDLSNFPRILRNNHCNVSIEAPLNFSNYQYPCTDYVSSCPTKFTNASLDSPCMFEPMAIVRSNGTSFRNIHCAICNGIGINNIECNVTISSKISHGKKEYRQIAIFNYNHNTVELLNANNEKVYLKELPYCSPGFLYDELKIECRQVDFSFILNCTTERLKEPEYSFNLDGYIYLNSSRTVLNQSEFIRDPEGISICVNNYKRKASMVPEMYLVFTGTLFSSVALIITITVYFCIPELRTLPGKLTIGLLSSMCATEFVYFIRLVIKRRLVCNVGDILLHYFVLASAFWMNVISFDALYVFSGIIKFPVAEKQGRRFIFYSLYAWMSPLIFVIATLIYLQTISPEDMHGYVCWYDRNEIPKWLLGVPLITLLSMNALIFLVTVVGLCLARKNSSKSLGVRTNIGIMIYFKLSLIMGLTWYILPIFGFAEMYDFFVISLIGNAYVGLIISITFLSTKVVRRHFKESCCKCWYKMHS